MAGIAMMCAAAIASASASELASATISSTPLSASTYQYNLVLHDTGTTDIGTFWFSWTPGDDFMATSPSNVTSPASWTDTITGGTAGDGFAILWTAAPGAALTPGNSLSGFSFQSTMTPAQIAGNSPFFPGVPVLTSFVYSGAPFSDAGVQFLVQPAGAPATAPEPSSLLMMVLGAGGAALVWRSRKSQALTAR